MKKVLQYVSKLCYSIIRISSVEVISMKGRYKALDVASYLIQYFDNNGKFITQLKLQKLLYFVEAYYMAVYDKGGLYLEDFYSWTYGPVIKEVYDKYKVFMSDPIVDLDNNSNIEFPNEVIDSIKVVVESFGGLSAFELIKLTHKKGSPWYETKNRGKISKLKTKQWFSELFISEA